MSIFSKKNKKKEKEIPRLPSLPELPDLPNFDNHPESKKIHSLPSFPSSETGNKFSQESIKGAINELNEEEIQIPQTTPEKISPMQKPITLESEPIFIRIDKFEESLNIFKKTKDKISEVEELLKQTKKIKEEESQELLSWETEIQKIKTQIEKIDKDIFSKI
ncbi:MAG: hypothetical protein U9Q99_01075 [Nanoarchaeota archaeon]|nr:hypothetical protein [Nanoarchaeota archaeon]